MGCGEYVASCGIEPFVVVGGGGLGWGEVVGLGEVLGCCL